MGADIHMFVEYGSYITRDNDQAWECVGGRWNPGRDYHMFAILAGVRDDWDDPHQLFEPKGVPEGRLSWEAEDYLHEDSDLHSHSWLTADEYAQCYAKRMLTNEWGPPAIGYEIVMVLLQTLKERDVPCRVLFAFDN